LIDEERRRKMHVIRHVQKFFAKGSFFCENLKAVNLAVLIIVNDIPREVDFITVARACAHLSYCLINFLENK